MKILITGSSGFLGSALSTKLKSFDQYTVYHYDMLEGFDICNKNQFESVVKNMEIDVVIHLAAIADLYIFHKNPEVGHRVNIEGTHNILKICQKYGARLLFASTCCSYGNNECHPSDEDSPLAPTEPYAKSKMISEKEIIEVGLPHCSMRLATFYGPNMRLALAPATFLHNAYHGKPITIDGTGNQTRTFTYIDDIVDGIICILESEPKYTVVNVTGTEEVSVLDIVESVKELMPEKEIKYRIW
jgi:nucleoside-diphosphate-sugar epimerase